MVNSALVIGAGNFRGWEATPGDLVLRSARSRLIVVQRGSGEG